MDINQIIPPEEFYIYSPLNVITNMFLALALGLVISWIYRRTHKGLSYSQSFVLTLIFVSIIVSSVMMIIGNSLARAFALVGALSIIRFRTVVKDTKDVTYVFFALAVGMASGTGNYFIAAVTTVIMGAASMVLHYLNYGSMYKSEFILRFVFDRDEGDDEEYIDVINKHSKRASLLNVEPSGNGRYMTVTYDIILRDNMKSDAFATDIDTVKGVKEVTLIAAKSDVDF
jgi:hypothetical protein